MWPFEKKYPIAGSGLLKGWTDWHSHILPGVDDGIKTMENSLKVLEYYEKIGVEEVWCTPHVMADTPNEPKNLRIQFEKLQAAYSGPLRLHLGAENMIDKLFEQRLADNDLLSLDNNCLLVETSYLYPPLNLWEMLDEIRSKGYWPVLAHPERYVYMSPDDYHRLMRRDVQLQLNLPSLSGLYGREARIKAIWLLKKGYYQRSGSDLHRLQPIIDAFDKKILNSEMVKALEEVVWR